MFWVGLFVIFYISFSSCGQQSMERTCFCSQMEKSNLQKFSLDNIQKLKAFKFFSRQRRTFYEKANHRKHPNR